MVQRAKVSLAVVGAEVVRPAPDHRIESVDDHLLGGGGASGFPVCPLCVSLLVSEGRLNDPGAFLIDALLGLLAGPDMGVNPFKVGLLSVFSDPVLPDVAAEEREASRSVRCWFQRVAHFRFCHAEAQAHGGEPVGNKYP